MIRNIYILLLLSLSVIHTQLNIDWLTIPAGNFTYGEEDSIFLIEYDFAIGKYEITND